MGAATADSVILFITADRGPGAGLLDALAGLAPVVARTLSDTEPLPPHVAVVLTDVDLTDRLVARGLRQVLSSWSVASRPAVLCLLDGNLHHAAMQARAMGAVVLQHDHHPDRVVEAVLRLMMPGLSPARGQALAQTAQMAGRARRQFAGIMRFAARDGAVSPEAISTGAELVLDAVTQTGVSTWLDVVRAYDDVTYQHCMLVAGLAAGFAEAIGFRRDDRQRLTRAALLHDVGKAFVPIDILNKPGRLTAEEMQVMRQHPATGHQMLVRQGGFDPAVLSVVRHHHEALDGSGYPDGLHGGQIGDLVRLITICDIFSALAERRPYKTERPPERCLEIMRGMGGKLDQDLLRAFAPMAMRLRDSATGAPVSDGSSSRAGGQAGHMERETALPV